MQGWNIFTHSVRMILGNLNAAFRVSLALYLLKVGVDVYFINNFGNVILAPQAGSGLVNVPPGFWSAWMVLMLFAIVTGLWIAVSWHRYVLLEENPGAILPPFLGDRILAYFWSSLALGFTVALAAIVPLIVIAIIGAGLFGMVGGQGMQALMTIMIGGPMMYVFYRLCLVLPAAALGEPKKLGESWGDTKPASNAIWQLVGIGIVATLVIRVPTYLSSDPTSVVNMFYTYVMGWLAMMVGVSVMTTLYGIYVEGREL